MTRTVFILWLAGLLGFGLLSRWVTGDDRAARCRLDGNRLVPIYRVDLMQDGKELASFCCVRCAAEWPDVRPGAYWRVRDEVTGQTLDASTACFVESSVVTIPSRRDRTHVFRHWPDAMTHAAAYDGRRIPNPLAGPADADAHVGDTPAPGEEDR